MKKKIESILGVICIGSLLLAVMGCENVDGSPAFEWIIPMLTITAVSGIILKRMDGRRNG